MGTPRKGDKSAIHTFNSTMMASFLQVIAKKNKQTEKKMPFNIRHKSWKKNTQKTWNKMTFCDVDLLQVESVL